MKKLTRDQLKKMNGGFREGGNFSSCAVTCSDGVSHSVDCGSNDCNTTNEGKVQCSTGQVIVSTQDPCA